MNLLAFWLRRLLTLVEMPLVFLSYIKKSYRQKPNWIKNKKMVDAIVSKLIQYGIADESNRLQYRYGVSALTILIPSIMTLVVIGIIFDELLFSIAFLIMYAKIREYFYGIHLKSKMLCFFGSNILFVAILISKRVLNVGWIISSSGIFILVVLSVIMQITKIYNKDKNCVKSIIIMCIALIMFIIGFVWQVEFLSIAIFYSVVSNFVLYMLKTLNDSRATVT